MQIKEHISKGVLKEGEMLPSIRLLAKNLEVSVITTKRAYSELEQEGLIVSVAGKGSYVSDLNKNTIKNTYRADIQKHIKAIQELSNASGIELKAIIKMMEDEFK